MEKKDHEPNPARFETYIQTKDHRGFRIQGSSYLYKFDRFGGWKDQYGNYYNADGDPDSDPEEALSAQKQSNPSEDVDDDFQREYGGNFVDYDDDNLEHIKKLEKQANNLLILDEYSHNVPLRVYFHNLDYSCTKEQLLQCFKDYEIINVILEMNQKGRNGSGHFIVKNVQSAAKLIHEQEKPVKNNRPIYFELQTYQELLMDPLSSEQLNTKVQEKQMWKRAPKKQEENKDTVIQSPQKQSIKTQKNKKYISKQQTQKKQQKKKQEIKKQQTKQQSPKKQEKKKIQQWKTYIFQVSYFKQKQSCKNWLTQSLGLKQGQDYIDLKKKTRIADKLPFGQIRLSKQALKKCNGKKYQQHIVYFKPFAE